VTARDVDGQIEITTRRTGLRPALLTRVACVIVGVGFLARWTAAVELTSPVLIAAFAAFWLFIAAGTAVTIRQILRRWRILIASKQLTVEAQIFSTVRRTAAPLHDVQVAGIDHSGRGAQLFPLYYLRIKVGEEWVELLAGFSRRELTFVSNILQEAVDGSRQAPTG
jgi:hypothetical protein